jgi:2-polyprenyl-3-methyl-5-hydroxy-6-metoxy-1,4-benzoquinol methylase
MFEQEYAPRWRKAAKIMTILCDFLQERASDSVVLDLGCANGLITETLSEGVGLVVGSDIDSTAIKVAQGLAGSGSRYLISDGAALPFAAGSFDVVVCAQVYEHLADRQKMAAEVWRVLRPNGICFFSGPNRLAVMEEHYWLPFLSWLPQRAADRYLQWTRRGTHYDVRPMSYWELRHLWQRFTIVDYSPRLLREPERFGVDDELGRFAWVKNLPLAFWKGVAPLVPNFNWVLVKDNGTY